jgi:hypothetical protein
MSVFADIPAARKAQQEVKAVGPPTP